MALEITKPTDEEFLLDLTTEMTLVANEPVHFWDVSCTPEGLSLGIDTNTGFFMFTPIKTGVYTITIKARSGGAEAETSFKVTVISLRWHHRPLAAGFSTAFVLDNGVGISTDFNEEGVHPVYLQEQREYKRIDEENAWLEES